MTKDTASTPQSVDTITQRKCAGLTKKARDVKTGVVEEDILEPVNGFKEMLGVEGLTVTTCMLKPKLLKMKIYKRNGNNLSVLVVMIFGKIKTVWLNTN